MFRYGEGVLNRIGQQGRDLCGDDVAFFWRNKEAAPVFEHRAQLIVDTAKERDAKGVVVVLTKFCDPEEFDYPIIKKTCDAAGLPVLLLEVDRQMANFEQARTALETFRDVIS